MKDTNKDQPNEETYGEVWEGPKREAFLSLGHITQSMEVWMPAKEVHPSLGVQSLYQGFIR